MEEEDFDSQGTALSVVLDECKATKAAPFKFLILP